jgi:hypothetical protein
VSLTLLLGILQLVRTAQGFGRTSTHVLLSCRGGEGLSIFGRGEDMKIGEPAMSAHDLYVKVTKSRPQISSDRLPPYLIWPAC